MICKFCGEKIEDNAKFCSKCGKGVEEIKPIEGVKSITNNEPGKGRAIASLVIGVISIISGGCFFVVPLVGLILGCSYKGKCTEKIIGIILNVIGLIISLIVVFAIIVFFGLAMTGFYDKTLSFDTGDSWENYAKNIERFDELDSSVTLTGKWKELSIDKSYLILNENDYYLYDDLFNMENNYTYGTYTIENKIEGFNGFGEYEELFNKISDELFEEFKNKNINILKLNPTKRVKNGVEVDEGYDENDLYRLTYIEDHNGTVELVTAGINNKTKHYYKVSKILGE